MDMLHAANHAVSENALRWPIEMDAVNMESTVKTTNRRTLHDVSVRILAGANIHETIQAHRRAWNNDPDISFSRPNPHGLHRLP